MNFSEIFEEGTKLHRRMNTYHRSSSLPVHCPANQCNAKKVCNCCGCSSLQCSNGLWCSNSRSCEWVHVQTLNCQALLGIASKTAYFPLGRHVEQEHDAAEGKTNFFHPSIHRTWTMTWKKAKVKTNELVTIFLNQPQLHLHAGLPSFLAGRTTSLVHVPAGSDYHWVYNIPKKNTTPCKTEIATQTIFTLHDTKIWFVLKI